MSEEVYVNDDKKKRLLRLARASIACRFEPGRPDIPDDPEFQEKRGVFVTLHKQGELRGCIGFIHGYKSIVDSVAEMAQSAAFQDPRFPPVRKGELDELQIEISILSNMIPVRDTSEIVIGRDGLFIRHPRGSGLLLPQVPVEWDWDRPTYLKHICLKAGLPDSAWKDPGAQLFRFTAEVFSEADFLIDKNQSPENLD